jgi:hypothetical protein
VEWAPDEEEKCLNVIIGRRALFIYVNKRQTICRKSIEAAGAAAAAQRREKFLIISSEADGIGH